MTDDLFEQAKQYIIETQRASVSQLQRKFRIGYLRAANIVNQLEKQDIVGPFEDGKPRKVLIGK